LIEQQKIYRGIWAPWGGVRFPEIGLPENQLGFLVHHKFLLIKFNQKYLKILRFVDCAVTVRRRPFVCIEILQGSLENYLGSSFTEST
jgi:hypothetical protein